MKISSEVTASIKTKLFNHGAEAVAAKEVVEAAAIVKEATTMVTALLRTTMANRMCSMMETPSKIMEHLRVRMLTRGDMRSGPTMNEELDKIFDTYLPRGRVLRCDSLPILSHHEASDILTKVKARNLEYVPFFYAHHWIAGIF